MKSGWIPHACQPLTPLLFLLLYFPCQCRLLTNDPPAVELQTISLKFSGTSTRLQTGQLGAWNKVHIRSIDKTLISTKHYTIHSAAGVGKANLGKLLQTHCPTNFKPGTLHLVWHIAWPRPTSNPWLGPSPLQAQEQSMTLSDTRGDWEEKEVRRRGGGEGGGGRLQQRISRQFSKAICYPKGRREGGFQ